MRNHVSSLQYDHCGQETQTPSQELTLGAWSVKAANSIWEVVTYMC